MDSNPKISIKKKIGAGKPYEYYERYQGKYDALNEIWEVAVSLRKQGYEMKLIEKKVAIGKRKPITVTEIWRRKK